MAALANFAGYQLVWLAVVSSAGAARPVLGIGAALAFVAIQIAVSRTRVADFGFVAVSIACGFVVDGTLAHFGYVHYAANEVALPAPLWILSLWAAFAMTLNHSLRWVLGRPFLAALLGLLGGPLAYAAASRGFGAVALEPPAWSSLGSVGVGWALALALFALVGERSRRAPQGEVPT